jgi:hypothetical protein
MRSASLNSSRDLARNFSRTTRIWIVLLVALAVLSFLAMRRSMGRAIGMKAETTASSSLSQLKPGDEAKVVLELTHVTQAASLEGNVLEKQTETVYRRTGTTIKIAFDASTPVVMGKTSDVHKGAVVHLTAKMTNDHALHAEQVVVLTGYVKVQ